MTMLEIFVFSISICILYLCIIRAFGYRIIKEGVAEKLITKTYFEGMRGTVRVMQEINFISKQDEKVFKDAISEKEENFNKEGNN